MAVSLEISQSEWPVLGHERPIRMLRRALQSGTLSHAYLFTGPAGVGKRTLAQAFSMAVNCESMDPSSGTFPTAPCGLCKACSRMARGAHPDLVVIDLVSQAALTYDPTKGKTQPAKEIRIDSVREMQASIGLQPFSGRKRVYIIGDADRLNEEASNCLLKTLEEPPSHALLLLLAPDEHSLLPTISSRCFHVALRALPVGTVEAALRERGIEPEEARLLASLTGGRPGRAFTLAGDKDALTHRKLALERVALLSGATITDRVGLAADLAKLFTDARPELYEMLDVWEGWWRDVLVTGASAGDLVANVDQEGAIRSSAGRVDVARAASALDLIEQTRRQLQENVNPRLALESLTLGLP